MTGQSSSQAATPIQWWKPALFFLVVIAGLWYVKWQPYNGKAFTAAETHSIGKSILAQALSRCHCRSLVCEMATLQRQSVYCCRNPQYR